MKVAWTRVARAALFDIGEFIARDNAPRAMSFVDELLEAGDAIGDMPRAFPLIPRLEHKGVRRRLHGRYVIVYRINHEMVEILQVVHGARDYIDALLRTDW